MTGRKRLEQTLFDDDLPGDSKTGRPGKGQIAFGIEGQKEHVRPQSSITEKEDRPLEKLKELDEKIADAISKVKVLKEEKQALERRIRELESQLNEKGQEAERLSSEKGAIKVQIEELLKELETLELE
jgi:cell division protein ZapB